MISICSLAPAMADRVSAIRDELKTCDDDKQRQSLNNELEVKLDLLKGMVEAARPLKTVYVLRTRMSDEERWGEPGYYRKRKDRDKDAAMNRVFGGIRTHSYEEKKTPEEIEELCD